MSATTVFGQVRSDQASTHAKRNAVIALTVIALFALSFFVGRATATNHVSSSSSAQVGSAEKLSPANRAIIAGDGAALSNVGSVGGIEKLSPANAAQIARDVAPVTEQLSAANAAQVANDVAPVSQFGQANTAVCVAGRPC
jgi:hypothetical protein